MSFLNESTNKQIVIFFYAKVAQLVEHDLAKVGVAGSNPVFRFFFPCRGGGIGRRKGLKIPCSFMDVPVRARPSVLDT